MSKCNCEHRKPRCEAGKKLYNKMRNRLLQRGLEMDARHMELWAKWEREHLKS
jgi:hypothetical protein